MDLSFITTPVFMAGVLGFLGGFIVGVIYISVLLWLGRVCVKFK